MFENKISISNALFIVITMLYKCWLEVGMSNSLCFYQKILNKDIEFYPSSILELRERHNT
jgi:hypothetical protein